jgi:hypothetical protein
MRHTVRGRPFLCHPPAFRQNAGRLSPRPQRLSSSAPGGGQANFRSTQER